jgi:hypothetical protein
MSGLNMNTKTLPTDQVAAIAAKAKAGLGGKALSKSAGKKVTPTVKMAKPKTAITAPAQSQWQGVASKMLNPGSASGF